MSDEGMKLPDNCLHTLTPWQRASSEPIGGAACCRADGRVLMLADWARFRETLIAANFWAIGSADEPQGLDGAQWLIEGRRGNAYRGVSRRSPPGELHELGRLFFALAGPPLSKVKLY
jgi:hypothetical protein